MIGVDTFQQHWNPQIVKIGGVGYCETEIIGYLQKKML